MVDKYQPVKQHLWGIFIWKKGAAALTSVKNLIKKKVIDSVVLLFIVHCKKANAMNVNIQSVKFVADAKLTTYVQKKIEKLNTFNDRIISIDVFLKLDNVVHTIKDKVVEIRVQIPRHQFFVKASSKSFEESFDSALESIVNQVKRKKEKQAA
jgi:putative sigma-54 modulation protein